MTLELWLSFHVRGFTVKLALCCFILPLFLFFLFFFFLPFSFSFLALLLFLCCFPYFSSPSFSVRLPCPLRTRFSIGPLRAPLGGHGHLQMPPSHQPISTAMPRASAQVSILTLIFFFFFNLFHFFFFFFFFFGTNSTLLYLLQFHSLQRFPPSSSSAQLRPCLSCRLASLSLSFVFFSFLPACLPACRPLDLYRYSGVWLSPAICCRVLLCFTSFLRLLACQFSFNPLGHPFRFLFFISEHLSSSLFRCSCPSLKLTGVLYHPHLCQTPLNLPSTSRSRDSRSVDFEIRPLAPSLTFFFFPIPVLPICTVC